MKRSVIGCGCVLACVVSSFAAAQVGPYNIDCDANGRTDTQPGASIDCDSNFIVDHCERPGLHFKSVTGTAAGLQAFNRFAVGDLGRGPSLDLVATTSDTILIVFDIGSPTRTQLTRVFATRTSIDAVAIADVNNDGRNDVVAVRDIDFVISLQNATDFNPTQVVTAASVGLTTGRFAQGLDLDSDTGNELLLVTTDGTARLVSTLLPAAVVSTIATGVSDPRFSFGPYVAGGFQLGVHEASRSRIFTRSGTTFALAANVPSSHRMYGGDLDGDGDWDLASRSSAWQIDVHRNNGAASFVQEPWTPMVSSAGNDAYPFPLPGGHGGVLLDADTRFVANRREAFQTPVRYSFTFDLPPVDIDGDGLLDLVDIASDRITVWSPVVRDPAGLAACDLGTFTPTAGGNTGDVTVLLRGVDFIDGDELELFRTGSVPIRSSPSVPLANQRGLTGTFNLRGAALGQWSLRVIRAGVTLRTSNQPFTVEPTRCDLSSASLAGPGTLRAGITTEYSVVFSNPCNVDLHNHTFWIDAPPGVELSPKQPLNPPPGTPTSSVPPTVTLPNGAGTSLPIIDPIIPPGSTHTFTFTVRTPTAQSVPLTLNSIPPAVSSSANTPAPAAPSSPCLEELLEYAFKKGVEKAVSGFGATACITSGVAAGLEVGSLGRKAAMGTLDGKGWFLGLTQVAAASGKAVLTCGGTALPEVSFGIYALEMLGVALDASQIYDACKQEEKQLNAQAVASRDPNDLVGPQGPCGDSRLVPGRLGFTARFENDDMASAAAAQVVVEIGLGGGLLARDVEVVAVGFGGHTEAIGRRLPVARVIDLRPWVDLPVAVDGREVDGTHVMFSFNSFDPATLAVATSANQGFLPPNQLSPEGEGFITFSVVAPSSLIGAQLGATAAITFDNNPPIIAPAWAGTLQPAVECMAAGGEDPGPTPMPPPEEPEPCKCGVGGGPSLLGLALLILWSRRQRPNAPGTQAVFARSDSQRPA